MRLRKFTLLIAVIGSGSGLLVTQPAFSQASLTPPGPPAPTMKTLDQVEARTIVNAANSPGDATHQFIITTGGSYYLTSNITGASGKNGITINADNVTLDLNGFALVGVAGSLSGLTVVGNHRHIAVHGGTVRSWPGAGVELGTTVLTEVHSLLVSGNGGFGISAGDTTTIRDCASRENGGDNFRTGAHAVISHCSAVLSTNGHGFNVTSDCQLSNCVSNGNAANGFTATVHTSLVDCVASSLNVIGFRVGAGCSITQCIARSNKDYGIYTDQAAVVSNCTASSQSGGTGIGIRVGDASTVNGCTASYNLYDGIQSTNQCLIANNTASYNGLPPNSLGSGIQTFGGTNRVDSNFVSSNYLVGIAFGPSDIVTRNTSRSNGSARYNLVASSNLGPTDQNPSTATSPWANF